MTATEIIALLREHGGDIELLPDGHRLALLHRRSIPDDLAAIAKSRAADLRAPGESCRRCGASWPEHFPLWGGHHAGQAKPGAMTDDAWKAAIDHLVDSAPYDEAERKVKAMLKQRFEEPALNAGQVQYLRGSLYKIYNGLPSNTPGYTAWRMVRLQINSESGGMVFGIILVFVASIISMAVVADRVAQLFLPFGIALAFVALQHWLQGLRVPR